MLVTKKSKNPLTGLLFSLKRAKVGSGFFLLYCAPMNEFSQAYKTYLPISYPPPFCPGRKLRSSPAKTPEKGYFLKKFFSLGRKKQIFAAQIGLFPQQQGIADLAKAPLPKKKGLAVERNFVLLVLPILRYFQTFFST